MAEAFAKLPTELANRRRARVGGSPRRCPFLPAHGPEARVQPGRGAADDHSLRSAARGRTAPFGALGRLRNAFSNGYPLSLEIRSTLIWEKVDLRVRTGIPYWAEYVLIRSLCAREEVIISHNSKLGAVIFNRRELSSIFVRQR